MSLEEIWDLTSIAARIERSNVSNEQIHPSPRVGRTPRPQQEGIPSVNQNGFIEGYKDTCGFPMFLAPDVNLGADDCPWHRPRGVSSTGAPGDRPGAALIAWFL